MVSGQRGLVCPNPPVLRFASFRRCGISIPAGFNQQKDVAMSHPRLFTLLAALTVAALAVFIGCSSEQDFSPTAPLKVSITTAKVIGPSEIVLCLDVSDSISGDELAEMVSALGGCLSNPDLVPQNGNVTVAALVYADTMAAAIATPVPVTEQNLQDVILPALEGLLTDRLVATNGFDLSGALDAALGILESSSISDRHVLIAGSGVADDAAAVAASCAALEAEGVMVSAIAVGADTAGAELLAACADATGGYFGEGQTDLDDVCAEAFAYMLQVELDLEPETADLARGAEHTVTATVFRGGNSAAFPVVGQEVDISVVAGPNQGDQMTAPTDTTGAVKLTYTGDGGPGTDTIVATSTHPGTGTAMVDTVTVTWANAAPSCDAGGPYTAEVMADTVLVQLDGSLSADADGDTLSYRWSVDCDDTAFNDATVMNPVLALFGDCVCADSLTVNLTVSDGFDSTSCQSVITIDDMREPVIEVRDQPLRIWPPNHKYEEITPDMLLASAEDACGRPIALDQVKVIEVRSDEPEDTNGDGSSLDDMVVHCPNRVMLRAERTGGGNGRVYTVVYRLDGENGTEVTAEAKVYVPHDASGHGAVEDDGMGYTITTDCSDEG
jgi:hypothetical protein